MQILCKELKELLIQNELYLSYWNDDDLQCRFRTARVLINKMAIRMSVAPHTKVNVTKLFYIVSIVP